MAENYDVVIIGGGPGGYSAALYCARAGLSTLVLEMLSPGGQMATTTQIENYPGFDEGVDGFELGERMRRGAERFGARTVFDEALSVSLADMPRRVVATAGEFEAKAVVLAMGAAPRKLGLPEEAGLLGRGVAYCAACDGMFFKGKTVAVAGGGNSAAEDALTLSRLCKRVYIVHRRDSLRATKSYLDPLRRAENIEFVWNAEINAILHNERVTGLALTDKPSGRKYELPCEGLFVAIGRTPNTELVKGKLDMDAEGYITADETTRTSLEGVFAVGDLRSKPLRQVVTAAADGAVASKYVEEYLLSL